MICPDDELTMERDPDGQVRYYCQNCLCEFDSFDETINHGMREPDEEETR